MRRWISVVCICALIPLAGITATAAPEYGVGRIEAEAMQLDEGYYTAQSEYASGGTYIKMTDRAQRDSVWCGAEFTFSGGTGVYNLDIVYPDYYSGSSTRKLYINGEQLRIWSGKITYGASVWGSRPVFEPEVIRTKTVQEVLLQQGDIIVEIDGKTVTSSNVISSAIAAKETGDTVSVVVVRGSQEITLTLPLSEYTPSTDAAANS